MDKPGIIDDYPLIVIINLGFLFIVHLAHANFYKPKF